MKPDIRAALSYVARRLNLQRIQLFFHDERLGHVDVMCDGMPDGNDKLHTLNNMFHVDFEGHLVKSSNGQRVPDDEPVVILRGRDRLALRTLEYYEKLAEEDGCTQWFLEKLDPPIQAFAKFADEHPERMKQPGITRGK